MSLSAVALLMASGASRNIAPNFAINAWIKTLFAAEKVSIVFSIFFIGDLEGADASSKLANSSFFHIM